MSCFVCCSGITWILLSSPVSVRRENQGFGCLHSIPPPSFVFHPLLHSPAQYTDGHTSFLPTPSREQASARVLSFPAEGQDSASQRQKREVRDSLY